MKKMVDGADVSCDIPLSVVICSLFRFKEVFLRGEKGNGGIGQAFLDHMVKRAKGHKSRTYERHRCGSPCPSRLLHVPPPFAVPSLGSGICLWREEEEYGQILDRIGTCTFSEATF